MDFPYFVSMNFTNAAAKFLLSSFPNDGEFEIEENLALNADLLEFGLLVYL